MNTKDSVTPLGNIMVCTYVCPPPAQGALHNARPVSPHCTEKLSVFGGVPFIVSLNVTVTAEEACARTGDAVSARAPRTKLHPMTNPRVLFTVVSPVDPAPQKGRIVARRP